MASSSRIHDAFTKPRLPDWGLVDALVTALAERIPRADPGAESERFHALWEAAAEASVEAVETSVALADDHDLVLFLAPPAVSPARANQFITATSPKGKSHFVTQERGERIFRVEGYLKALERNEEPEVPQNEIVEDMISLLLDWAGDIGARIRYARQKVEGFRNSTDSVHEERILSARFEELDEMASELNNVMHKCANIKGAAGFEKMRKALTVRQANFSSKIIGLSQPLNIPT
ncbi:hypothetical protein [Streptomyces sp. bgisy095]|uniref:hypothetical protein n=1 Tax=unclassified Streptomyces TaxID=2593676 RepID=UPI003D70252D